MAIAIAPSRPGDVAVRTIRAELNYLAAMSERPRYHANDQSRDVLALEPHRVTIEDGRTLATTPSLAAEGLKLVHAPTRIRDFYDRDSVNKHYAEEISDLVARETGADRVVVSSPGVLRFAERSGDSGRLNNSRPARFIHNDISEATARTMAARALPGGAEELATFRSFAYYNVWRPFSPPPQDVPLALLDTRTLAVKDLIEADAVFDEAGKPDWSFEGFLLRPDPAHRWIYFSDMEAEDAILFTTFGYRDGQPVYVPHSGFDDPSCPADAPPRASIEMRALAFFN